MICLELL